jgi:hypothetical protein
MLDPYQGNRAAALPDAQPAPDSSASAFAGGGRADPQAVGLEAKEFELALRSGKEFAYVLALPARVGLACDEVHALLQRVPWLASSFPFRTTAPGRGVVEDYPDEQALAARILPLVETRPWLIARQGLAGIELSGDGMPRLDAVGWLSKAGAP